MSSRHNRHYARSVLEAQPDPWARPATRTSELSVLAMYNRLDRKAAQMEEERPGIIPLVTPLPEETDDELNYLCQVTDSDWGKGDTDDWVTGSSAGGAPSDGESSRAESSSSRGSNSDDNDPVAETQSMKDGAWWVGKQPERSVKEPRRPRLWNVPDDGTAARHQDRLEAVIHMRNCVGELGSRYHRRADLDIRNLKKEIIQNTPPRQYLRKPQNASDPEEASSVEEDPAVEEEDPAVGDDRFL